MDEISIEFIHNERTSRSGNFLYVTGRLKYRDRCWKASEWKGKRFGTNSVVIEKTRTYVSDIRVGKGNRNKLHRPMQLEQERVNRGTSLQSYLNLFAVLITAPMKEFGWLYSRMNYDEDYTQCASFGPPLITVIDGEITEAIGWKKLDDSGSSKEIFSTKEYTSTGRWTNSQLAYLGPECYYDYTDHPL